MYDIEGLEAKWRRYRRRKMLPYVVLGLFVLSVVIGSVWYLQTAKIDSRSITMKEKDKSIKSIAKKSLKLQSVYVRNDTIDTLEKNVTSHTAPVDSPLSDNVIARTPVDVKQKHKRKVLIEVVDTKSRKELKAIEKRFKLAHDPNDSLFLAKRYLAMRKFKKAEYWALQTNRLDEDVEDSWLVFAVAKAKQGKIDDALKVLQVYIDKTGSERAKELYGSIKARKTLPLTW